MNYRNKRVFAFLFDLTLVTIIATMLGGINFLNHRSLSETTYNLYETEFNNNIEQFSEDARINPSFNTIKEFVRDNALIFYELNKDNVSIYCWYIVVVILYFGVFTYFTRGQTVGKKLAKLRVVNMDDSDPKMWKLILRSLFGGLTIFYGYNLIIIIRNILLFVLSAYNLMMVSLFLTFISFGIELACLLTFLIRKDNRSIPDLIFKTKVIEVRK